MIFGLEFIRKLNPCKWRYKQPLDDGVEHFGFIAQEVDQIAPKEKYGFVIKDTDGVYRISPAELIGPIVKAIQEIDQRLKVLEDRTWIHHK